MMSNGNSSACSSRSRRRSAGTRSAGRRRGTRSERRAPRQARTDRVVLVAVGVALADGARHGDRHEPELGPRTRRASSSASRHRLQRERRRALQPVGRGGAVRRQPVVVRAAARDREVDVVERVEARGWPRRRAPRRRCPRRPCRRAGPSGRCRRRAGWSPPDPLGDPRAATGPGRDEPTVDLVARRAALVDARAGDGGP